MNEVVVSLHEVSIGFKKINFEKINSVAHTGTLTALMGINGVGKSCLLKTMAGLIKSIAGNIHIDQRDLVEYSSRELAQKLAIVLTEKIQVDFLKVSELVTLGRSPYTNWSGDMTARDNEIILDSLKIVGLSELSQNYFAQLSDGQKQKAMIARALAQTTKILLLDEPTTYLDIPSKIELMKELKKISVEKNLAIILSTHDLDLVQNYADQVWIMGKGAEFITGSPAELLAAGQFKKHFYI